MRQIHFVFFYHTISLLNYPMPCEFVTISFWRIWALGFRKKAYLRTWGCVITNWNGALNEGCSWRSNYNVWNYVWISIPVISWCYNFIKYSLRRQNNLMFILPTTFRTQKSASSHGKPYSMIVSRSIKHIRLMRTIFLFQIYTRKF